MANSEYGYLFETSPRKEKVDYEQEVRVRKSANEKTNAEQNKRVKQKQVVNEKLKRKMEVKKNMRNVAYVLAVFSVLLLICYRYSLITESFNRKENLKKDLKAVEKENEQLQVAIENSMNSSNIEQKAKELLGMQKLDVSQKKYVTLPKKDYVESATEEIVIDQEPKTLMQIIKDKITGEE